MHQGETGGSPVLVGEGVQMKMLIGGHVSTVHVGVEVTLSIHIAAT